jgi:hypothetical protein
MGGTATEPILAAAAVGQERPHVFYPKEGAASPLGPRTAES